MRDIDFKVISATQNSSKFQKTRFCKEKSVEDVVTLGPTAQATIVYITFWMKYRNQKVWDSVWGSKSADDAVPSKQAGSTSTYINTFTFLSEDWGMLNLDSETLLLSKDPICVLFRNCPRTFGIFTQWYQFIPSLVHPRPPRGPAQVEITKNCFFD